MTRRGSVALLLAAFLVALQRADQLGLGHVHVLRLGQQGDGLGLVLGLVALATTAIVCGDTAGKLLTGAGVQPLFVAWSRFALAALLLFWVLGLGPAGLGRLLDWRLILRAALIVGAIASILTALRTEPIANVFGAFFIGPIVAYVLSALLLGERVSWARTVMLALGFAGVLLVVRPGGEMGTGMIFAVLAGTLYGSYLAATRWLTAFYPPPFLLGSQLLIGAGLLLPLLPQKTSQRSRPTSSASGASAARWPAAPTSRASRQAAQADSARRARRVRWRRCCDR